ncbi:MAG: hypothetical protein QOH36_1044 [Actinomycetota bacterium]|nr:hypothetical protein [Actinomycetota bacterium]
MTELEQALGRLPEDTAFAPEPFAAIEARAERRRRRRWQGRGAASVVGVVALAVALSALPSDQGRVVDTARNPASRGDIPATRGGVSPTTSIAPAPDTTLADEVVAPTAPGPSVEPETRIPPTTAYDPDGSVSSPIQPAPSDPFVPPGTDPSLSACPPAEVALTVATGKAAYALGERVTGSSVLENRSRAACLVPARVRWAVQDLAGNDVSGFAYTADYALPVRAEPGQSFPGTFSWNQNNCGGPACTPVPAGTYVLIGRWTEGGSFTAQTTFQIGT